jgi:hypothetical protein
MEERAAHRQQNIPPQPRNAQLPCDLVWRYACGREFLSSLLVNLSRHWPPYDHAGFTGVTIGVYLLLPDVDLHLPEVDDDYVLHWTRGRTGGNM